jgi:hypothetical protein
MCFNLYPSKELSPGLGLYSGIFAMYLQRPLNNTTGRMATILFYAVCLLYVLSTVAVIVDLLSIILTLVSNNSICKNIIFFISVVQAYSNSLSPIDIESLQFHIAIIQNIASGCCDFLAQCILVRINHLSCTYHPFYSPKSSKIYRCWIVWGQNIRVVIVPSILAITYLGQSIDSHLISRFQSIASSYLDTSGRWQNGICTRRTCGRFLGSPDTSNKFRSVHGR